MSNSLEGIAVLDFPKCKGKVIISETTKNDTLLFTVSIKGLKPGKHGFHIHEAGNLSEGCGSCCSHFNPLGKNHGGLDGGLNRHLGDLGNIEADKNGNCETTMYVKHLRLRGNKYNIMGRSIVVHADPDDLGKGGNPESLKTGNAGKRIGCAVIGYKTGYYF